uniref:F-box domain-containing protein n=1 Tax=Pristionchus pacificus TaxID=54126 RepID=A0A8R1UWP4_PRIPA
MVKQVLHDTVHRSLATLPPDIIRIIIKLIEELDGFPIEKLRLISRNWNTMVLEHILYRRDHPPLESVRFHNCAAANIAVSLKLKDISHKHNFKVLCRGWNTSSLADSFYSPPLCLSRFRFSSREPCLLLFIICDCYIVMFFHHFVSLLLLLLPILSLANSWIDKNEEVLNNMTRLENIFIRCSSVNKLHIHYLNWRSMDAIRTTLKDVPIKNLIILQEKLDKHSRAIIEEMVRTHQIEKIILSIRKIETNSLYNFCAQVTETAHHVNIYERILRSDKIFGLPREFWDRKVLEMDNEFFSIQVMNGERLQMGCDAYLYGPHLLRLRIDASLYRKTNFPVD